MSFRHGNGASTWQRRFANHPYSPRKPPNQRVCIQLPWLADGKLFIWTQTVGPRFRCRGSVLVDSSFQQIILLEMKARFRINRQLPSNAFFKGIDNVVLLPEQLFSD